MSEPVPAVVTLHVWRVPPRRIPRAVAQMGAGRRPLRRTPGLRFAKLLGIGDGATFTIRDSDPTRWALLSAWADPGAAGAFEQSAVARKWRRLAVEAWRVDLLPLAARGRWAGREPFGQPRAARWEGPVAALTRARLRPHKAATFWRAVPPVASDLWSGRSGGAARPGPRLALGIGEAPVLFQGTFSVWDDADALTGFAYRSPAHLDAIERTATEGWYAEELFARFGVLRSAGTLAGRDPLA